MESWANLKNRAEIFFIRADLDIRNSLAYHLALAFAFLDRFSKVPTEMKYLLFLSVIPKQYSLVIESVLPFHNMKSVRYNAHVGKTWANHFEEIHISAAHFFSLLSYYYFHVIRASISFSWHDVYYFRSFPLSIILTTILKFVVLFRMPISSMCRFTGASFFLVWVKLAGEQFSIVR